MAFLRLARARARSVLLGCLLASATAPLIRAQGGAPAAQGAAPGTQTGETAVKAAFLYNFTKFVEWPPAAFGDASAPFHVCVFGDASFKRDVEEMVTGETIGGRPLRVLTPDAAGAKGCHLAYFGSVDGERAAHLLAAMRGVPILTVGEGRRFLDQGGLISFVLEANRVRFDVNKRAVERAGLTVSSKLLRVARRVENDGSQP